MTRESMESVVRSVVSKIAHCDYQAAVEMCAATRLTAQDIREVIRDYGRTIVEPPLDAYKRLDAIAVDGSAKPTWSVYVPLWTTEEGRSDLTLEVTLTERRDGWDIQLGDLRVL